MNLRSALVLGVAFSIVAASCSSGSSSPAASPSTSAASVGAVSGASQPPTVGSVVGSGPVTASGDTVATSESSASSAAPTAATTPATEAPATTTVDRAAFIAGTTPDRNLLPAPVDPATLPTDPIDPSVTADALAVQVLAGGDGAVSAFETGLQLSGIGIVDLDGSVVATGAAPAQNINAEAGEVLMIPDMIENGQAEPLDSLLGMVAALRADTVSVDDLRTALESDMFAATNSDAGPTFNFFASFLNSLGTHDSGTVGLLQPLEPGDLINGPQEYLVLLRLAGDVALSNPAAAPAPGPSRVVHAAANNDCNFDTTGTQLGDLSAAGLGQFFGKVIPEVQLPTAVKNAVAAAILALVKLAFSIATFHVSMHLENDPLIRTMTTTPGQERTLYTEIEFRTGAGRYANCFRFLLAFFGQDFSLPNNSAVSGAEVHWSPGLQFGDRVRFAPYGTNKSAVDAVTDNNGEARTTLRGVEQKMNLDNRYKPYDSRLVVLADFNTKGSSLTQDLTDTFGPLISGVNGVAGAPAVIIGILQSLLDRFGLWSARASVGVRDYYKDIKITGRAGYYDPGVDAFPPVSGIKCGGLGGDWSVDSEGKTLTFTLADDGTGVYDSPDILEPADIKADLAAGIITFTNSVSIQTIPIQLGDFCDDG
ncbi:MAG: hypothetical protein JWN62_2409 [Acidimicrobiales bacterium]|nr:hypothetical protein [Acidimicrobiales bacterium]